MSVTNNIAGKTVIITGASSGIGATTARHLANLGARVVLSARRIDRLAQLVSEIEQAGGQALALAADVAKRTDVEALITTALEHFGRIDVLINNAGIMPLSPLAKLKVDEWDQTIDINIKGVLYGIAAVLPHFSKQNSGHVINIASIAGHKVFTPIGTVYSASKFAVRAISEGLRVEVGPNIRTTIISPGAVESELKLHSTDNDASAALRDFYDTHQIPAEAIARAIAYAIDQPANVDVNEILIRPTSQEF